jgi:hypothetical protein
MSESSILNRLLKMNDITQNYFEKRKVNINFHDESTLHLLENLIDKEFHDEKEITREHLIPYGYCLGQVVTNNIPGALWDDIPDQDPESMSISIGVADAGASRLMIYPMRRVGRYVAERNSSILTFYDFIKQTVLQNIDISNVEFGKQYQFNNMVFKIRSVKGLNEKTNQSEEGEI